MQATETPESGTSLESAELSLLVAKKYCKHSWMDISNILKWCKKCGTLEKLEQVDTIPITEKRKLIRPENYGN